ncbi:S-adenosyl-L-methionine-dependent methyltransferase [Zychaea mexicana]|uniref:S-adenosyl-L-methionine-dependent methyltransferase n=1 Tax=Zychaea mexicana TaxID=64656 RepID=UPI0022FEFF56|nr:S-adenosyl-L-methionine-dependent methyltransferase [Zychaea mexicana]KAI9488719.1 S-adenosyl-L-methionine-dependent methyltransferase [Zychaea mexicana]
MEEERSPKRQKSEEPVETEIEYSVEELKKGADFIDAISAGDLEKAKTLEKEGADICFNGNEQGRTPLHYAAEKGHKDIVKWLLSESHPYNLLDKDQVTAGELALKNKHNDIYEMLVEEGTRAELLLRALKASFAAEDDDDDDKVEEGEKEEKDKRKTNVPNEEYLNQKLHYDDNKLMDENNDAVMMGWEGPLMVEHAKVMCPREGLDVLNVGFGLGLIDMELQKYKPRNHFIIEAHPDVYAHMKEQGWDKKPGVTILFGRWQDMVPTLTQAFDGIFFDTYGEFYDDLRAFHDAVPNILNEGGIYTWFNGLGATNQFFHDIYCRVSEVDLHDFGLSTEYVDIPIATADEKGVWDGVRQRYWVLDTYKLPICKFLD